MERKASAWIGLCLGGTGVLVPALLATLGGVAVGRIPWIALPGVWLGGNALLLLAALSRASIVQGEAKARGFRHSGTRRLVVVPAAVYRPTSPRSRAR